MTASPRLAPLRTRLTNLRDRVFHPQTLVQSEQTPYTVIATHDIVQLRAYTPLPGVAQRQTPLVLVPPLAVNMSIYDLFPDRSLVRDLLARGFALYMVDWGRPSARHDHWRLQTYITELLPNMLAQVRAHAQTQVLSLHGWSFGGLFAYGYTAWSQDADIRNLVLIGAPCDYHNNGALGQQYKAIGRAVRWLDARAPIKPSKLSPRVFRSPGWVNSALYKMTSPVASIKPYFDLLRDAGDRARVSSHATNAAFLDDMVAYPGAVVQDTFVQLWGQNILAQGRLPVDDERARLSNIHANVFLAAGSTDPVVTPSAARALLQWISSDDVHYQEIAAGHMAILASARAQTELWPKVGDWLAARDA